MFVNLAPEHLYLITGLKITMKSFRFTSIYLCNVHYIDGIENMKIQLWKTNLVLV